MENKKSPIVFALLAWFLGWLGAQYFYVGKTKGGIIWLLLSAVTCNLLGIVDAIQAIMALVKGQDWLDEKFVNNDKTLPIL